jgi:alpha-beta hydrolase superfamily lysophospholipase
MLGHSLGGVILIRYLQEYPAVPARGAILSAPALGVAMDVPRWKEQLARTLYYLVPALPMSTGLDPAYLTHDRQIVDAYVRDPLVHDRVTPRLYGEIMREVDLAFEKAPKLRIPVLMLVPSEDRITRPDQMQRFAAAVGRPQAVQMVTFPGLYHEVLNEISRSSIVADLLGWIERRIEAQPLAAGADGPLS